MNQKLANSFNTILPDFVRKNICIFIFLFCLNPVVNAQPIASPVPSAIYDLENKTASIKAEINNPSNASMRTEYPLQDYYHVPNLTSHAKTNTLIADITPPSDPSNLVATTSGIFSVYVRFNASVDVESGINYYAFAIGTAPGLSNIRYWQSLGTNTVTQSFSLKNLNIAEGSVFYFTIYAVNGAGLNSNSVSTAPIVMNWDNLGDTTNNITIQYAPQGYDVNGSTVIAGWSASQIATYNSFISRMLPIIKEIYGPPSRPNTITLVRNLYYSGSNIYFPSSNEIHKDDSFYPQLLTHELIHAFRDDVILAMDSNWSYNPKLSGFEESFAQGVSYACMNRYVRLYPNDSLVNSSYLFGSSMDWDYDFRNVSNISTEDFWSDYGGMNLHWERYEMGAAAMRKIQLEDSLIFKKFNLAYYNYLNTHHFATPTRSLLINLLSSVITSVENKPVADWIGKQRIFDCTIQPGKKSWVRTQHYPWSEYIIFQYLHYYETFSNGSDWAYYNYNTGSWVYYSLNGSTGSGSVKNFKDSIFWQRNLTISNNPSGFGSDAVSFTTDNDLTPWPGGDTADYVLNMTPFGLYKLQFTFGTTTTTAYRIMGSQLRNTTGVFGGLLNSKGGQIYIDHDGFPAGPPLNIVNGAFWGTRTWASIPNILTGGTDSKPGKVTFRYIDSLGNVYRTYRNIDWGSSAGNQVFLLDVNDMEGCSTAEIFNNNQDDDCDGLIDESSPVTLNIRAYIEGYYVSNGAMTPVLYNTGLTNNQTICDTVTVELHRSVPPYDLIQSVKGLISTNGYGSFIFSSFTDNNSYYLVLKHRNSITTWSAGPVTFTGSVISYSFADALNSAYGNNLRNLGDGNFALYSGDVSDVQLGRSYQDGVIESQDYSDMEGAVYFTLTGYIPEDITGDGVVESADYGLMENNVYYTVVVIHP